MAVSPSHQAMIKLSPGRDAGPKQGACVMELASMLAGGPFSDHPPTVCGDRGVPAQPQRRRG
jgi:hypothetical protein